MEAKPAPRRVALIGLMGAGKSRVGQLTAAAAAWPFVDADAAAEEEAGCPVSEFFRREGEPSFRRLETRLLAGLAALDPPLVLATGGGVVEAPENRRILREAFLVVWLRVDPEEAARRLLKGGGRPLLAAGDPRETLTRLAERRDPLYAETAHLTLRTDRMSHAEDLRDELLDALGVR
jgi:shikimate kinase